MCDTFLPFSPPLIGEEEIVAARQSHFISEGEQ